MKVILVNGSPHKEGCTYTALAEVEKDLFCSTHHIRDILR